MTGVVGFANTNADMAGMSGGDVFVVACDGELILARGEINGSIEHKPVFLVAILSSDARPLVGTLINRLILS
ncbi:MAG: hypothetical protein M9963_06690 [Kiritimatiellae bacterium]|nr:hypothetical protein [Kiritimatiellia bacterium]